MSDNLNLDKLLDGLYRRRTDPATGQIRLSKEAVAKSLPDSPAKAYRYLIESMEAVPDDYTARTFEESVRVAKQLEWALAKKNFEVEFANQGSVTNNTHIKVHSDIDLLVCTKVFAFLEPPRQPVIPWPGDPREHIRAIRTVCQEALVHAYRAAEVDDSGGKALSISGGSLQRKVDVVPGSWLYGEDYLISREPMHRGVQILDAHSSEWIRNYPFHHNGRIHERDLETSGNLRRLIRLFKSLSADAGNTSYLSSYDIAGLCFNIPAQTISAGSSATQLLLAAIRFLCEVLPDPTRRASLLVPNGTRRVFEEHREAGMISDLLTLIKSAIELTELAERRRAAA